MTPTVPIRTPILRDERAAYGEQVVAEVAKALTAEFGRGFGRRSLYRRMRFAEVYPDAEIVTALRSQLSRTHFGEFIAVDVSGDGVEGPVTYGLQIALLAG